MTDKPIKLSDTGRAMLTLANTREDRLVPPPNLPVAAARQVVRSLSNAGLVEEIDQPQDESGFFWREDDGGMRLALRATEKGLAAIGHATAATAAPQMPQTFTQAVVGFLAEEGCNATVLQEDEARMMVQDGHANGRSAAQVAGDILTWLAETEEAEAEGATGVETGLGDAAQPEDSSAITCKAPGADATGADARPIADTPAPTTPTRATLRQAAEAVLAAWSDEGNRDANLETAIATLRQALGTRSARNVSSAPRQPREGTKQSKVLEMLRRPEGATVAQIAEAMIWAPHTVRGFFAGLKKRQGISVVASERVRQAGPEGVKGSYTIYRIAEAS